MYQPLTGRARKVMLGANQEALRFNHECVGTEHVLLALIVEGRGVAANVLRHVNLDLRKLRTEIETLMEVGPRIVPANMRLPQTAHAANAIRFAIQEADYLAHNYIGTEHLLLGLLREDEGLAAQVLMSHGLELLAVRRQVLKLLESGVRYDKPIIGPRREIEDLPPQLQLAVSELNADLDRMNREKNQAIVEQDFVKAVCLRDAADEVKRRKKAVINDWLAHHPVDAAWLSWGGTAVLKLAQRIKQRYRWDALPELASALEQAGCTDAEMLGHCRQAEEHSSQCWVIDLLLAKAT